jgi:hypothetical protein
VKTNTNGLLLKINKNEYSMYRKIKYIKSRIIVKKTKVNYFINLANFNKSLSSDIRDNFNLLTGCCPGRCCYTCFSC